jgi:mannose-6-phosphate isomerase-like protein (cupin superfamily)
MPGYKTLTLDAAPTQRDEDTGADWITLRHQLGVTAFGVNAWRAPEAGLQVIVDHDETDSRHQEIYVVVSGHATFTVGGDEIDAPAGTVIFIEDPELQRVGIAKEPGTTVLAVGARPGAIFTLSAWETDSIA